MSKLLGGYPEPNHHCQVKTDTPDVTNISDMMNVLGMTNTSGVLCQLQLAYLVLH